MADYIKKIRTSNGDKQIDYEALANLPTIPLVDMSLTNEGAAADAKATGDAINLVNTRVEEKVENPLTGVVGQILEIETVDESGKPKTYKAVNKPSGGGEVTDEQISNAVDNYMTAHPFTETDPTVPDWAKHPEKPRYTAEEVGADASGTAESKVSEHNVSDTAHNDIRLLIDGLTTRLNALADSDDTTFDQMSEVVAYIKSNKSLIDAITTSKVNVSDIIDNLTTNASNKPLSAAQGVALKTMIDGITIPTTLPNPNALTFTGVATGSYDGSSPIEINIPGGGGTDVAVDTTLSVAGQAADAKATGDAISSLSAKLTEEIPFGEKNIELEVFKADLMDFVYDSEMQTYGTPSPFVVNMLIEEGKTYDVVWDGVEYTGLIPYDVSGILSIGGNMNISAETPEERFDFSTYPFIISITAYNGVFSGGILTNSTESTHNVEVSTTETKLIKLPDKFQNQVNWNETDETKASCLLNRPFGEYETGEIMSIYSTTIESMYKIDQKNCYFIDLENTFILEEGRKYQVILNGITYDKLICVTDETGNCPVLRIGSQGDKLLLGMGDYPFAITYSTSEGNYLYIYSTEGEPTSVELTINQYVIGVKQIDAKYIPDGVGGSGLPEITEADNGKIMQVVDGVWSAVEVIDGNTALFYADGNEVTY